MSTWLTYCESLTSMQMSVLVPTPFGRRARASWTRTMKVTKAGRVEKRRGWGFTLLDADEEWLIRTGPTDIGAGWSANQNQISALSGEGNNPGLGCFSPF